MDGTARARGASLLSAIERGDEEALRGDLSRLLDAGDMAALSGAIAAASPVPEVASMLGDALAEEAQQVSAPGYRAALFCIPVLLDPGTAPSFDACAVGEMLAAMAAPGERVCVAPGWLRAGDLLSLGLQGQRALARELGSAAWNGVPAAAVPTTAFREPRDGLEVSGRGRPAVRVALRLVVGAVAAAPRDTGGLFRALVDGEIDDDAFDALETCLVGACGADLTACRPGRPVAAAAAASGSLATAALEARLASVAMQIGRRPIIHFHVDGDTLRVAVTGDGANVLDGFQLPSATLDAALLEAALGAHGHVVPHDGADTLPGAPGPTLH